MDAKVKQILTAVYELEGLLNVVKNRDVSHRGLIDELIREKSATISLLVNEMYTGNSCDDEEFVTPAIETDFVVEPAPIMTNSDDRQPLESPSELTDEHLTETSEEEIDPEVYIPEQVSDDVQFASVPENEPSEQPLGESDCPEDKPAEIDDYADDEPSDDEYLDEEYHEDADIEDEINGYNDYNVGFDDEQDDTELRVDEQLSRNLSKNLKKAFTLNDRFRFRRELFGNKDVEFNDTLNLVEAMHSYEEAEDYFYNDLQWDSESPEVIDFMKIIAKHFS